jgi:SpoVK/Ycf46/Vps4 family AAA+-type ATPase
MTVEITQPTDTSQPATFLFRSPDPPLHLADIMHQVIGATTTPINNNHHHQGNNNSSRTLPFRRHNLFLPLPPQHQQEDHDSTMFDEFSQFGSVFDELQAMMEAFASQFSPLKEQYDNNDEESVGSYRRRSYKQFEDVPGSYNNNNSKGNSTTTSVSQFDADQRMMLTLKDKLESMGATVFLPNKNTVTTKDKGESIDWGILAGYDKEKRMIEDTMLLPLQHGHVYDEIRAGTRSTDNGNVSAGGTGSTNYNTTTNNNESSSSMSASRARAVLLEGPPGCGKTTAARVIASQASVPLIYIPLEAIVSKWYGETEKKLAFILKLCESFPAAASGGGGGGCIVFIDELDALATTRGGDMHEATRRVLGVLLRHLDGFEGRKGSIVVGATNRKQDLDPALRSRFSATIEFPLPDERGRKSIIAKYAKHLKESELGELARVTDGMSGRDLRDVAEIAERTWASKVIREKEKRGRLPPLGEYLEATNLGMRK